MSFQATTKTARHRATPAAVSEATRASPCRLRACRAVVERRAAPRTRAAAADATSASRSSRSADGQHRIRDVADDPARPAGEHEDAVGEEDRLGDRVGHEHDARPRLAPDGLQVDVEPLAGQRVERAERLVEEQDRRLEHDGPGDRGPLAHPAGQLVRPVGVDVGAGRPGRSVSRARASRWTRVQPASSSGKATLSSVERHGSRRGSWKTKPDPRVRPVTAWPSIATLPPRRARAGPPRSRRSVLLPVPLAPMSDDELAAGDRERDVLDRRGATVPGSVNASSRASMAGARRGPGARRAALSSAVARVNAVLESAWSPLRPTEAPSDASGHVVDRPTPRRRRDQRPLPSGLYRRLRFGGPWPPFGSADTPRRFAAEPLVGSTRLRGPYHRSGIAPCPESTASLARWGRVTPARPSDGRQLAQAADRRGDGRPQLDDTPRTGRRTGAAAGSGSIRWSMRTMARIAARTSACHPTAVAPMIAAPSTAVSRTAGTATGTPGRRP